MYILDMTRRYKETHPWLTFEFQPPHDIVSMRMGEAFSKCQHLIGTPLQPIVAANLASIYLAKGVQGTTAIEGNTLSESEVDAILKNQKTLPPSQQYLEQEVRNVQRVLAAIYQDSANLDFRLSPEWLQSQNQQILEGLDLPEHVVPGQYTSSTLTVGNVYRSPTPEDIPYLVQKLCDWINERITAGKQLSDDYRFFNAVITAILAHIYLVWIHPFGDGNGRTARAVECAILAHTGLVPWVSSNLLSDFYNRTRSRYYSKLADASRRNDLQGFVTYALDGFVDMLREQIRDVQAMQHRVAWVNYIHEMLQTQAPSVATRRRRDLALAMPIGERTPKSKLHHLTPMLAEQYAGRSDKTLTHDINRLKELGLIEGDKRTGYAPRANLIHAFLPAGYVTPNR
jgi:Fic family protein